jgi:hypothetical protein
VEGTLVSYFILAHLFPFFHLSYFSFLIESLSFPILVESLVEFQFFILLSRLNYSFEFVLLNFRNFLQIFFFMYNYRC